MVSATVYVEGGGDSKALKTACRKGFGKFVEKAGAAGAMPRIVACGSRGDAYQSFRTGHTHATGSVLLLVDAEGPVTAAGTWQHLENSDGWDRPDAAVDGQCHLMVHVMESWFLADADALEAFYGQGFRRHALPPNPMLEDISKQRVLDGLDQAALDTKKRGYNKSAHGFEILERLAPSKVRDASPFAGLFIDAVLS